MQILIHITSHGVAPRAVHIRVEPLSLLDHPRHVVKDPRLQHFTICNRTPGGERGLSLACSRRRWRGAWFGSALEGGFGTGRRVETSRDPWHVALGVCDDLDTIGKFRHYR